MLIVESIKQTVIGTAGINGHLHQFERRIEISTLTIQ